MGPEARQPGGSDHAIAGLAARQHGNLTRRQLVQQLGLDDQAIALRVRGGRLHRVHRGVYAAGRPPITPLERAAAAVLACGEHGALSHLAAVALWGLRDRWPSAFDVTVTAGNPRPAGITVHRSPGLLSRDLVTKFGIRVTSVARVVLDCVPALAPRQVTRLVNDALLTPHLSRERLADVLARFPRHPGARLLRPFAALADGPTRSEMEDRFLAFCEQRGLPRPRTGAVIAGHEVDAVFDDQRLIVELDGWRFHRARASFEADRARDARTLVAGYRTLRLTWERLTGRADEVDAELRALLGLSPEGAR